MKKLSIIIPYYNTEKYTDELLHVLEPQMTKECEIILVDDGSKEPYEPWLENILVLRHLSNKGVSAARNTGLKKARGKYIAFIDSDDLVSDDYIERILKTIESNPDTVYLSWKSIDGKLGKIIQSKEDEFNAWNRCIWNRVFSKEYIYGLSFDEDKLIAEDDDFLKRLPIPVSKTYIEEPVYYYRSGRANGLTDRAKKGEFRPRIKTQVVVYCGNMQKIGGIETWMYYWCRNMYKKYDIIVAFKEDMSGKQIERLSRYVQVLKLGNKIIECDTLINTRITDKVPDGIKAKQIIQMVHGCHSALFNCEIQPNYNKLVFVSKAAADTFDVDNYEVIHNFTFPEQERNRCLFLITASRFTREKGGERMLKMAAALRKANIEFIWFVFSHQDTKLADGMVKLPETLNIKDYISRCDYLVQLSDSEGFGYSIVEALEMGVPVITTPIDVLKELKFRDGVDGYIVPFDMKDIKPERFLNDNLKPEYRGDNNENIQKQWVKLLGKTEPTGDYLKEGSHVQIEIIEGYFDMELNRNMIIGEVVTMRKARANLVIGCGKGVRL